MTVLSSVYKLSPGFLPQGNGDASYQNEGTVANDPLAVMAEVGALDKNSGKLGYMARYVLDDTVFSGTQLPLDGSATLTKAKVSFEIHTTAVVDGADGEIKLGLMHRFFNFWLADGNAFGVPSYPLRSSLPFPTTSVDAIIGSRLLDDAFVSTAAPILYTAATFAAGNTITIGEGFAATFTATDLVSSLQSQLDQIVAQPGFGSAIAMLLDPQDIPAAEENFALWTSADEPSHAGMILTLEWFDTNTTIKSRGLTVGSAVASDGLDVSGSVDSHGLSSQSAVDASLIVEDEES